MLFGGMSVIIRNVLTAIKSLYNDKIFCEKLNCGGKKANWVLNLNGPKIVINIYKHRIKNRGAIEWEL